MATEGCGKTFGHGEGSCRKGSLCQSCQVKLHALVLCGRSLTLLKSIELLIRVNAPLTDGCATHKEVKKLIAELEA